MLATQGASLFFLNEAIAVDTLSTNPEWKSIKELAKKIGTASVSRPCLYLLDFDVAFHSFAQLRNACLFQENYDHSRSDNITLVIISNCSFQNIQVSKIK